MIFGSCLDDPRLPPSPSYCGHVADPARAAQPAPWGRAFWLTKS
jgi:hypothetical protein